MEAVQASGTTCVKALLYIQRKSESDGGFFQNSEILALYFLYLYNPASYARPAFPGAQINSSHPVCQMRSASAVNRTHHIGLVNLRTMLLGYLAKRLSKKLCELLDCSLKLNAKLTTGFPSVFIPSPIVCKTLIPYTLKDTEPRNLILKMCNRA